MTIIFALHVRFVRLLIICYFITGVIMNTGRRQSTALSVGSTPINKVITIILAAQKTSPAYVAGALDEV